MTPEAPERRLGAYSAGRPGPTVVALGALHGNEPAALQAIRAVLAQLHERRPPLHGELVGLVGNRGALAEQRRYRERDLNRRWLAADIAALSDPAQARAGAEDREQRELLAQLVPLVARAREPIVFLDLHSTSGPGAPFVCFSDVLRNRRLALALGIPAILGLEELLDGSLVGWLSELGHVALAIEGGQNQDPRTARCHEAALWLALQACGALEPGDVPALAERQALLDEATRGLPRIVELRYRHLVKEGDGFVMAPGFANFTPLARGQIVAHDRHGDVRAPEAGLMLMPLYQGQGDDGYFLARPVRRFWLRLSALLRRLRAERLVPLLPGVRAHPDEPGSFLADPRVARFQTVNVFHLLGFRHMRESREGLVFARRRQDSQGLQPLPPELAPFRPR